MRIRRKKVDELVYSFIDRINKEKLTAEELVILLSEVLTRVGFSFYYRIERPEKSVPTAMLSRDEIESIWLNDPTPGSSLLKLGYDIQDVLLVRERKEENSE